MPVSQSPAPTLLVCSLQNIPQFPQGNRTMQVFCKCDEFMAALMEVCVSLIPRLPFFSGRSLGMRLGLCVNIQCYQSQCLLLSRSACRSTETGTGDPTLLAQEEGEDLG